MVPLTGKKLILLYVTQTNTVTSVLSVSFSTVLPSDLAAVELLSAFDC